MGEASTMTDGCAHGTRHATYLRRGHGSRGEVVGGQQHHVGLTTSYISIWAIAGRKTPISPAGKEALQGPGQICESLGQ